MAEKTILVDYNFGDAAKVTGLPAPTAPSDAANKAYVDANSGGGGVTLGKLIAMKRYYPGL